MFDFSPIFHEKYLPYTLELGRSFVQPQYQASRVGRKSLFALDNLWDGIGALSVIHPEVKYLFGKVTMYQHYNKQARDLLLYFMANHCPDPEGLLRPIKPLGYHGDTSGYAQYFTATTYLENYKTLIKQMRAMGENIPPLINAYLNISPTMRSFGTSPNEGFGAVEETGILVTIADIYEEKRRRHVDTFIRNEQQPPLIQD